MTVNESFFTNFLIGDFNYFPGIHSKKKEKLDVLQNSILLEKKKIQQEGSSIEVKKIPVNLCLTNFRSHGNKF